MHAGPEEIERTSAPDSRGGGPALTGAVKRPSLKPKPRGGKPAPTKPQVAPEEQSERDRQRHEAELAAKLVAEAEATRAKRAAEEEQSRLDREREAEARKKRDDEAEAKRVRRAAEDAAIEGAKVLAVEAAKQAAEESKATRAAKVKSEKRVEEVQAILAAVQLTPGSVFGKQLSITGKMVDSVKIDLNNTAIVDPAGLDHVRPPGRPSGAGGFSKEIYRRVGISGDKAFPREVVENVKKVGDAFPHGYRYERGVLDVIHTVGPDFRVLPKGEATYPRGLARSQLATVYGNVLRAYLDVHEDTYRTVRRLRLVPISGGVFAGSLLPDIPRLTFEALGDAIMSLSEEQREDLEELKMALHVFREDEWDAFVAGGFTPWKRGSKT